MTARDVPVGFGLRAPRDGRHRRKGSDRGGIGASQGLGSGDGFLKLIEVSQVMVNVRFLQKGENPNYGNPTLCQTCNLSRSGLSD